MLTRYSEMISKPIQTVMYLQNHYVSHCLLSIQSKERAGSGMAAPNLNATYFHTTQDCNATESE